MEEAVTDIVKLDAALKYIDEHPEQWNQASWGDRWSCGTTFCVAGVVALLDGAQLAWSGMWCGEQRLRYADGKTPRAYACESLGLDDDRASQLFHAENSRQALAEMRDALAADPDASTEVLYAIAERNGNR
jgi:hypothetical protein